MTKSRTVGLRAALLTGVCAAACAAGTGSASAASCTGANTVAGQGSTLQNTEQGVWSHSPSGTTNTFGSSSIGCSGKTVNYNLLASPNNITGSQAALNAWGASGGTFNTNLNFLGSDDAPTSTQITSIKGQDGGSSVVVVPVSQTAIAVMVHPPANCTISTITRANLQNAFNGTAATWSAIGATGSGCTGAITRVVRSDGSGTTYNFEQYLGLVNSAALKCTGTTQKTWNQLRTANPNTVWPQTSDCTASGDPASVTALDPKSGGGGVATEVDAVAGTIGYAALPDAEKHLTAANLVSVETSATGAGTKVYRSPVAASGSDANCSPTYAVPAGAQTTGSGVDVDWSGVYGNATQPSAGYGICLLTYDVSLANNSAAFGSTNGPGIATTVKDYLGYVVDSSANGGQTAQVGHYYAKLPTATSAANNVQAAATYAVSKIG